MDGNGSRPPARWKLPSWWRIHASQPDQEPWRRLALGLHYNQPQSGRPRTAMLLSVAPGEVGARSSLALAAAFADEVGKPVLLVDADPGARTLSALVDCSDARGLTDALFDERLTAPEITLPTTNPNVSFVAAGLLAERITSVASDRLAALLEVFREGYQFVLIHGGEVPINALALAFVPLAGCTLLIGAENETTIEDLDAAQETLQIRRARDVGLVVVNRVRDAP